MDVQDSIIILIPEPKRYTDHLQGLHSEIWKSLDVQEYLNGERETWTNSDEKNKKTPRQIALEFL